MRNPTAAGAGRSQLQDMDVADIDPLKRTTGARTGGRRSAARDSLFLSATIRSAGESGEDVVPVRVRNLSAVGMMADHNGVSLPGDRVIVTLRGIGEVKGKVAWVRNNRIGVAFESEVDPKRARKPVKPLPEAAAKTLRIF